MINPTFQLVLFYKNIYDAYDRFLYQAICVPQTSVYSPTNGFNI